MKETFSDLADEFQNFQEIARFINPSPGEIPRLNGVEIAGVTIPYNAEGIGGDHTVYIDFKKRYDLDRLADEAEAEGRPEVARKLLGLKRRGGILLADVAGHRVTDALVSAMLHQAFLLGVIYELYLSGEITTRLFEYINTRFYKTTAVSKYFSMIYGEIVDDGRFRFLSAGHPPPAVFSLEYGRFVRISADRLRSFPPVGMLPSRHVREEPGESVLIGYKKLYEVNEISLLAAGDLLLLQTDGLSEHLDGEYFPERLEAVLRRHGDEPVAELSEIVREDIVRSGEPDDDISFVLIRRTR